MTVMKVQSTFKRTQASEWMRKEPDAFAISINLLMLTICIIFSRIISVGYFWCCKNQNFSILSSSFDLTSSLCLHSHFSFCVSVILLSSLFFRLHFFLFNQFFASVNFFKWLLSLASHNFRTPRTLSSWKWILPSLYVYIKVAAKK